MRTATRLFCCLLLASALSLGAQEYAEEPTTPAETPQPASEQPIEFDLSPVDGEPEDEFGASEERDFELIEGLLEEGTDVMEAPSAYDPGDRRDPFRSLIRNTENRAAVPTGPRPEGVPGMLIDEISVTGIWVTPDGPVAQVQSTDTPMSYLLREGDQLYDGEVIRISLTRAGGAEVLFKQSVTDSTAPKPFRDVVRRLDN
ncbi:MAG: hypothetical protein AAGK22_06985 [Acidobacteriota bacterium]